MAEEKEEVFSRVVLLCNGARVLMDEAIPILIRLEDWAETAEGQNKLFHLREACFRQLYDGHADVPPDMVPIFCEARFLDSDGTIDTRVRDIVFASVRGTDRALHISPPYTKSWDKTVADMFTTREKIGIKLGDLDLVDVLVNAPGLGDMNEKAELISWAEYIRKHRRVGPSDLPPLSTN